jgi:hypothetical protein
MSGEQVIAVNVGLHSPFYHQRPEARGVTETPSPALKPHAESEPIFTLPRVRFSLTAIGYRHSVCH